MSFLRGGGRTTTGSALDATGAGRRDGEKIGRSRVPDNLASGTPHSGLALVGCGGAAGCATAPALTAGCGAAGLTAGGPRVSSAISASSASPAAEVDGEAAWAESSNESTTMVKRRLISYLAIVRTL